MAPKRVGFASAMSSVHKYAMTGNEVNAFVNVFQVFLWTGSYSNLAFFFVSWRRGAVMLALFIMNFEQ